MQSISHMRALLESRGLRPRKRFGQHFLHDQNQIRKLTAAADVSQGDCVLEVGPGTGALTEALLEAGANVIACEIDRNLASLLEETFGDRITLINDDCLEKGRSLNPRVAHAIGDRAAETTTFKLIANLPYNAASPLITTLLLHHPKCVGQYVTIQQEVADRLAAKPSSKAYGPLGIIVQAFAEIQIIGLISPTCFWPQPDVHSAMVAIVPRTERDVKAPTEFAKFVTTLFSKRRKQLGSIFGRATEWPTGIDADRRPDALTVEQLITLQNFMSDSAV